MAVPMHGALFPLRRFVGLIGQGQQQLGFFSNKHLVGFAMGGAMLSQTDFLETPLQSFLVGLLDIPKTTPRQDLFMFHQRAVFEMVHPGGTLVLAERGAARAFELNPDNRSIQHTQGEIARRQADETDDPLRKRSLRRFTREKLGVDGSQLSEYDLYTRALLAIDELKELSNCLEMPDDKPPPRAFGTCQQL